MTNRNRMETFKAGRNKALFVLFMLSLFVCSCDKAQMEEGRVVPEAVVEPVQMDEPAQTEESAGNTAPDPEAYYRIPLKETPEYHSFIYRYERIRDEQLPLLEESVRQYGLRVDMADSQSLNSAGYGLYEKKDYAGAVRFFREAAYVDISNVYAHYNLACTLSLIKVDLTERLGRRNSILGNGEDEILTDTYRLYSEIRGSAANENYAPTMIYDELYDHLTLSLLQSEEYISKSQNDPDLQFVQKQQRFKNLLRNIQTGRLNALYGRWFTNNIWNPVFNFMMDQRLCSVFYNNSYLAFNILSYFRNTSLLIDAKDYEPDPSNELGYVIGSGDVQFTLYDLAEDGSLLFVVGEDHLEPPGYIEITHTEVYTRSVPCTWYNDKEMSWDSVFELIRFDYSYTSYFMRSVSDERVSIRALVSLLRMAAVQNDMVNLQNTLEYVDNPKELIDISGAILYAAYSGSEESLKFLLQCNADITIQVNTRTMDYNFLALAVGYDFFFELYDGYKDTLAQTTEQKTAIVEMTFPNTRLREEIRERLGF